MFAPPPPREAPVDKVVELGQGPANHQLVVAAGSSDVGIEIRYQVGRGLPRLPGLVTHLPPDPGACFPTDVEVHAPVTPA